MMKVSLAPRQLFLIDAIGALFSAVSLGVVLVQFNSYIGMPIDTLYLLTGLAVIFAFYSTSCYLFFPNNWKLFLKIIATVNALYSFLTIGLIISHFQQLTILGLSYFVTEIIVLVVLIRWEYKIAVKH